MRLVAWLVALALSTGCVASTRITPVVSPASEEQEDSEAEADGELDRDPGPEGEELAVESSEATVEVPGETEGAEADGEGAAAEEESVIDDPEETASTEGIEEASGEEAEGTEVAPEASDGPCDCAGGACCDGCHLRAKGYVCDPNNLQGIRCRDPFACGGNYDKVVRVVFCTGRSSECQTAPGVTSELRVTGHSACAANQVCADDAQCLASDRCP